MDEDEGLRAGQEKHKNEQEKQSKAARKLGKGEGMVPARQGAERAIIDQLIQSGKSNHRSIDSKQGAGGCPPPAPM